METQTRQIDDIDCWAEQTFGRHVASTKRVMIRKRLQQSADRAKFDALFRRYPLGQLIMQK